MKKNVERCWVCELPLPAKQTGAITTGYGLDNEGHKICYACCADSDRQWMNEHDQITLYLSDRQEQGLTRYYVSNWPGSLEYRAFDVVEGRHNIARTQTRFSFRDDNGQLWHGRQYGQWTQLAHCRKAKQNK